MTRQVLKWPVHVDDQPHIIGTGPVALVDAGPGPGARTDVVQVWTDESGEPSRTRTVQVFGTGQPVPADALHVGSAVVGPFVWHIFEVSM